MAYTASFIATFFDTAGPVVVLNKGVKNSANTERWLNDVGRIFSGILYSSAAFYCDQMLTDLDLTVGNTGNLDSDLTIKSQILCESLKLCLR